MSASDTAPDAGPQLATVAVSAHYARPSHVLVNGVDIADKLTGMALEVGGYGAIPRLTLDVAADVDIDMTGIVQLLPTADGSAGSRGDVVREWLDALDPQQVEQAVMASMSMTTGPVQAVLDELRRRAAATR